MGRAVDLFYEEMVFPIPAGTIKTPIVRSVEVADLSYMMLQSNGFQEPAGWCEDSY